MQMLTQLSYRRVLGRVDLSVVVLKCVQRFDATMFSCLSPMTTKVSTGRLK